MKSFVRVLGIALVFAFAALAAQAEGSPAAPKSPVDGKVQASTQWCYGTCTVTCESGQVYYFTTRDYSCCPMAQLTCTYSNAEWWPNYSLECFDAVAETC